MWKLQNFSATQIWREIKVCEFGASIIVILTLFEALDFDFYEFLFIVKAEMNQKSKFRVFKITKMEFLELLVSQKLISRKIWVTENGLNFHTVLGKNMFFMKNGFSIRIEYQIVWKKLLLEKEQNSKVCIYCQ